jgi:SurA N-terminal domain/PPIC-type PPIASE domain
MHVMRRFFPAIVAILVLLAAPACGGGSGSGSNVSVPAGDVAIVGDRTITVAQLDRQIELRVRAAKIQKQQLPKSGTQAYREQVVQPLVDRLVFNAQVENIAKNLDITVSDDEIQKAIDDAVKQNYGGSRDAFEKDVKKYGFTDEEVAQLLVRPSLLSKKIQEKVQSEEKITDADVKAYYDTHKKDFVTQDSRVVDFLLVGSRQDAIDARAALSTPGAKWQTVAKKYAIPPGPPSTGGKFTATNQPGALEENFRKEVFGDLQTGVLSALVPVSDSYQKSSLQGKCKPDCFFLIKPLAGVTKGKQQSFSDVEAQIRSQLEQTQVQQNVQKRMQKLLDAQKKLTHYAPAYKPPAAPKPAGSTGTSTPTS